jgi:hypothetical protein
MDSLKDLTNALKDYHVNVSVSEARSKGKYFKVRGVKQLFEINYSKPPTVKYLKNISELYKDKDGIYIIHNKRKIYGNIVDSEKTKTMNQITDSLSKLSTDYNYLKGV